MAEEKTFSLCFLFCITGILRALITEKKFELKSMTLCAPKNACAKPQCYFSLAMSSFILQAHTSCASLPCSPIFTAFLCTEHGRIAPLTKPPYHTITNTGERIQERDQELAVSFLEASSSPTYLHSTSATHLHCFQGSCILILLLSTKFRPPPKLLSSGLSDL